MKNCESTEKFTNDFLNYKLNANQNEIEEKNLRVVRAINNF